MNKPTSAEEMELSRVLSDPIFVRSPVLARLLQYLVEMTLKGEGKTIKSYSVAVDALGRDSGGDPQIDTYARVQVGRLRKALDMYYAGPGRDHPHRLMIASGSYEVRLMPLDRPEDPSSTTKPASASRYLPRVRLAVGVAAASAAGLGLLTFYQGQQAASIAQWRDGNFPTVSVRLDPNSNRLANASLAEDIRQKLQRNLELHEGIRVTHGTSQPTNYIAYVSTVRRGADHGATIMVVDRASDRMIWSSDSLASGNNGSAGASDLFVARSAFRISQPTGVIHANERRRQYALDTPYGCWLEFTARIHDTPMRHSGIAGCSEDWHSAAPNHPGTAAIRGWALVDGSVSQLTEARRQGEVRRAIEIMERTARIDPDSPLLQMSLMRAYAYANDRPAALAAGKRAVSLNPGNADVAAIVGTFMLLQGNLDGEALLDAALARHFNPQPWYYIGKFAAAMMRDDLRGAWTAHSHLQRMPDRGALKPVAESALYARAGNLSRARQAWKEAQEIQPALRLPPDVFLARMPLAPNVRNQLKRWLRPLLVEAEA